MQIHIALYQWTERTSREEVDHALAEVRALSDKVPGILDIVTGENTSPYGEGYTHAILVRGENLAAIDAYRAHPEHEAVASAIEAMESRGIGVDFSA